MILTTAQLIELTGYKRPSAIRRWLDAEKWPYAVGKNGWPKVLTSVLDAKLGLGDKGISQPNGRNQLILFRKRQTAV